MKIDWHWKKGKAGIDIVWIKFGFFLLPTFKIGYSPYCGNYIDFRFLYLLVTFYNGKRIRRNTK